MLVVIAIPKVSRDQLVALGRKKNSLTVVEPEYVVDIPVPRDSLSRRRFGSIERRVKVSPFFCVGLFDVTLIGPLGLPFTRHGRLVVEPISDRVLPAALALTIRELGFWRFFLEWILSMFPLLRLEPCRELPSGAHLHSTGSTGNPITPVYGSWFWEQMPQIRAIEEHNKKWEMKRS